ncbi:hypothetical protein E4U55_005016 [Claviceps digitariae]|nr:hypothetical protein E4U55_005016 [Claviceps digitariae]
MPSPSPPAFQIRTHPSKHRALHATRAFQAGQTIHIFLSPLLLHPMLKHLSSICTHCFRLPQTGTQSSSLRACSACHAAYYCSQACQRAAWTAIHSRECKALRRVNNRSSSTGAAAELPTPVRILLQALLRKDIEDGLTGLDGHVEERRRRGGRGWADVEMMAGAACAFAFWGREREEHVRRGIEMLCKIQTNAFHTSGTDPPELAIFFDPTLAMANHSCIPNATVLFIGRTAVLRAERAIQEGDEIEICYTDYTNPISERKIALQEYYFACQCSRCADNLNVYQVCAQFSSTNTTNMTAFPHTSCSVVGSNTPQLQHHPGASDPHKIQIAAQFCSAPDPELTGSSPEARRLLKLHLRRYMALMDNDLWAVSPLPQTLTEVSLCYTHEQKFTYAVVVAAMVAVECDPYRYAAPFHIVRLQNLLMVVKLLVWTAEDAAALRGRDPGQQSSLGGSMAASRAGAAGHLEGEILETLAEMDQVSLSQMLLIMVLKAASPAEMGPDQSSLGLQARELQDDIEALDGREKELSLIYAWRDDPNSEASRVFFEYAVVKQMTALASLGKRVMKLEWQV